MNRALSIPKQLSFPGLCPISKAVEKMAESGAEDRGAVYTRQEVVNFILDLAGYTADKPLHTFKLLEPSFGHGDFLLPAVERLINAFQCFGSQDNPIQALKDSIRAVELHKDSTAIVSEKLQITLSKAGLNQDQISLLLGFWIISGDFLLTELPSGFTHIVGNPPYVRQEKIPDTLLAEYRSRYKTIYDRADIYIPFIERSLATLQKNGTLAFICSDRWMKNKYGGPLRRMIADGYHIDFIVDMVNTPAFHNDVIAYPAIIVIKRKHGMTTRVAHRPVIDSRTLKNLAHEMLREKQTPESNIIELKNIANGSEPWIINPPEQLQIVRRLEANFPTLEEAGCHVGIGVATGADKIYIGPLEALPVEEDRKLPLAMTKDIASGKVEWRGLGVINPFNNDGTLVDLDSYPRLREYLNCNVDVIMRRNVAKRNKHGWYRTIDRIYPELAREPKLLIPDIKGKANVVYENGTLYPHHNLYYITSSTWDLLALQAVLLSDITRLFISTYSTTMHGAYLRFQAQYLRRIRIPKWGNVPVKIRKALEKSALSGNIDACNQAAFDLYQLSPQEQTCILAMN